MAASTHHILVFDTDNTVVLAGAYLKQKRHSGAKILAPDDIDKAAGPVFDAKQDETPWKLHIIQHGCTGMDHFEGKTMAEVAALIVKSGLAEQPNQTSDDRGCPVVRLDVCQAGLTNLGVKSTLEQLAAALQTELGNRKTPAKTRVVLWGGKGLVIAPWSGRRGERMIAEPTRDSDVGKQWDKAKDDFKKSVGIDFDDDVSAGLKAAKASAPSGNKLTPAEELLRKKLEKISAIEKTCPMGLSLQAKAEVAWTLYEEAMQKFHGALKEDASLTLDKDAKGGGLWKFHWFRSLFEGAQAYRDRKSTYLARAEAKC